MSRLLIIIAAVFILAAACIAEPAIVIRNNHDLTYTGPITFHTSLPDGPYTGDAVRGKVSSGTARMEGIIAGRSEVQLQPGQPKSVWAGSFSIKTGIGDAGLLWDERTIGRMEFGLVVIHGREAGSTDVPANFKPLDLVFSDKFDGTYTGKCLYSDYEVEITLTQYDRGWLDMDATVARVEDGPESAYIALVRRITMPGMDGMRMRWNGRVVDGLDVPTEGDRICTLGHGVDWCSWTRGSLALAAVNKFTPGYTYQNSVGRWALANYFYARERVIRDGDSLYLITEIAGPNPEQEGKGAMGVKTYAPPAKGEPIKLGYRFAVSQSPKQGWEDSQFQTYAGYLYVTESGDQATVDLGVPYVEFGTSYFPYSTMTENFDYYRTTGLDREGWWPFSPKMWEDWRKFVPQMQTDLHIIRAMGFEWVRPHHMELLGEMSRDNAIAYLDFYMAECHKLGLKVLVDTGGSPEWLKLVAGRYKDVVKRVELENEILIGGIRPGDAERWTGQYKAVKEVAPETQVFLTGACNQGQFERLVQLGVPFDRVGYHNYKHGPAWKEAISSVALAVGGHAAALGKPITLGEFNWKFLTRHSPEDRAKEFREIYSEMMKPRAIPEFFQFHWQETMSVNPRLTRQGIRHYETIYLDRRPKPEAFELMELIKQYARPDSPVRELPILVCNTELRNGKGDAGVIIDNKTNRTVTIRITPENFCGLNVSMNGSSTVTLKPNQRFSGKLDVNIKPDAQPGTYHHFLKVDYAGKTAYGWGTVSNPGEPQFDKELILPDLVEYPQGAAIVETFGYNEPVCVAFGKDCPTIELEMAYQIFNTLQSATGRDLRLCSTEDIPEIYMKNCNLILVGTPETNLLIAKVSPKTTPGKGTILVHEVDASRQWLILTGDKPETVQAAATDFTLRYWKNAKDSAIRITGMEKGAALGNKAAPGDVNLP